MPVLLATLLTTLKSALGGILVSLMTERFMKWAVMAAARALVKSTKTPHDDEWYSKVHEAVYGEKYEPKR